MPTDPVAAAFARLAANARATSPLEARYQSVGTVLDRFLGALNGLIVLGILLAVALSTCALLAL